MKRSEGTEKVPACLQIITFTNNQQQKTVKNANNFSEFLGKMAFLKSRTFNLKVFKHFFSALKRSDWG
jgi:hypothetical protein